ncbi:aminotransferase class IV [Pelagicoccus mobilis]
MSRGFAFGFGVFETMKFLEGRPCFFGEHMTRLQRAIAAAGLSVQIDVRELRERAAKLFEAEGVESGVFKIIISDVDKDTAVAMFVRNGTLPPDPEPIKAIQSEVSKASKAFTSRHKSLNYMESVLELEKAKAAGYDECVFSNENDHLTECAIANLFWIKQGVLQTPKLDCGLLDGIVRGKIIGMAHQMGLSVEEGEFGVQDLLEADEAFVTSSGNGPRSISSFTDLAGNKKSYVVELLPRLRSAFLELEQEEALKSE